MAKYYVVEHTVEFKDQPSVQMTTMVKTTSKNPLYFKRVGKATDRAIRDVIAKYPNWQRTTSTPVAYVETTMCGNHKRVLGLQSRNVRDLNRE